MNYLPNVCVRVLDVNPAVYLGTGTCGGSKSSYVLPFSLARVAGVIIRLASYCASDTVDKTVFSLLTWGNIVYGSVKPMKCPLHLLLIRVTPGPSRLFCLHR